MSPASHVVVDVGSTTTKAVLFRERDGRPELVRREAPTTVEAPHADVRVGLRAALGALQEAAGERLLDGDRPARPILLTSSAGGGLALVVTGLVRAVTSRSAERAALGAGAVVQDVITLDDGRVPHRKIEDVRRLRPDMVLFAGGFDGDAVSGPVFLAEILRRADLRPKLDPEARLPVLYAGNANARELVRDTLGDGALFRAVPNLRPESGRENLEDARAAIHEIFMEHVMSHAPGYGGLRDWVEAPILPTPSALVMILEAATRDTDERILAIDIGGATTDVFTAARGTVLRTVSANLGMSYSALHVLQAGGLRIVRETLGDEVDERAIWNRIGAKHLEPTRLPRTPDDVRAERALATAAVRLAVRDHLEVIEGVRLSRGAEALSLGARETRPRKEEREPFPLTGYDLVVGSGGVLSHSPRAATATILANALEPAPATRLAVDRAFVLPHLGALTAVDPAAARRLLRDLALVPLGTLLAPVRRARAGSELRVSGEGLAATATAGELRVVPLAADRSVETRFRGKGLKLAVRTATATGGALGLMIDARPRPLATRTATFDPDPPEPPEDTRPAPARGPGVVEGPLRERRELAVPGRVLVSVGEAVEPESPVARGSILLRRPFFLEAGRALGTDAAGLEPHLLRRPGDEVVAGDVIARRDRGRFRAADEFVSPVAGTIERMLPDGTLLVREPEDHAVENRTVEVARALGVKPGALGAWLRVEVGQEVEKGQELARRGTGPAADVCHAPVRGRVRRIDREFGLVLLTPLRRDLGVAAWLPGHVESRSDRGATIVASGVTLTGAWGLGQEAHGPLVVDGVEAGAVAAFTAMRPDAIAEAAEANAAALVVGGLDLDRLRDADPSFPVVLLEGFGARRMADDAAAALRAHEGRVALVDGTTELRVGVRRPRALLPG